MKISLSKLNDIIAHLMWISRDTLDMDRLLDGEEYLGYARKILDLLGADYNDAEAAYAKRMGKKEV